MICFLQCDRNESPAELPHFKPDSYYQGLLGKQPKIIRKRKWQVLSVFQEQSWVDDPSVFSMSEPAKHQGEFQTERAEDIVIVDYDDDDEEQGQSEEDIGVQDIGDEEDSGRDNNKRDDDGQSIQVSSSSAHAQSTLR